MVNSFPKRDSFKNDVTGNNTTTTSRKQNKETRISTDAINPTG
jgi:hypothetical protein